jgi:hypothetical protein
MNRAAQTKYRIRQPIQLGALLFQPSRPSRLRKWRSGWRALMSMIYAWVHSEIAATHRIYANNLAVSVLQACRECTLTQSARTELRLHDLQESSRRRSQMCD